jgi:hypothetical protein
VRRAHRDRPTNLTTRCARRTLQPWFRYHNYVMAIMSASALSGLLSVNDCIARSSPDIYRLRCYLSAKDAKDAKMLNLLVVFCLIRVFCVLRGPLLFTNLYTKSLGSCLRRSDINIICVYLRSSVDFLNVHSGLYR